MTSMDLSQRLRFSSLVILLLLASTFSSSVLAMSNPCDPDYVSVDDNGWFVVSASADMTGVTDTTNLNCTTGAIENQSFEKVRLKNGNYYISEVVLNCPPSKNCLLSGTTKAGTIVNIVDGSIACEAQWENLYATSGITVLGSATVRYMTLNAHEPCAQDGFLPSMIQFTGEPAVLDSPVLQATCNNATSFAVLDRVDINATSDRIDSGLLVGPQSQFFDGTCQYLLTGSFNGLRNSIDGPFACAAISMQGRARTGLDFLEAQNCPFGVVIYNAGQTFRMTRSDILVDSRTSDDEDVGGVIALRDQFGPETSSVTIDQSTIEVISGPGTPEAIGVFVEDILLSQELVNTSTGGPVTKDASTPAAVDSSLTNIDVTVTNTSFILDGEVTTVARFINVDNSIFNANEMIGNGRAGLEIMVPLVNSPVIKSGQSHNVQVAAEGSRATGAGAFFNRDFFFLLQASGSTGEGDNIELSPRSSLETYTVLWDHFFMGAGTEDNTIGPHDGALVTDFGCNFNLNVVDGGCALNPHTYFAG